MTLATAMKRSVRMMLRAAGWEIGRPEFLESLLMPDHLSKLFRRCRIDTVLDVGANRGQYRDFLRNNVGFAGRIVSFEPVEQNVRFLRDRARRDGSWIVLAHALGSENRVMPINVMRSDKFSSFLLPDDSLVQQFRAANVVDHVEHVPVRRLDAALDELSRGFDLGRVYLKMDTQGYDLEVVKGCGAALRAIRALQTEASLRAIYEGAPHFTTMTSYLRNEGFDITGIFPVSRDAMMRVIEWDCVMVNGDLPMEPS